MIRKRKLGNTGLMVSELGFGALEIGRDWAADVNPHAGHLSEAEAGRLLNEILDAGINFIDTAPAYWHSETYIGNTISHRRSEYVLATKVGEHCDPDGSYYDYSAAATAKFIDESLRRLKTDLIDLIQIHSAPMDVLDSGETLGALIEARDAGKVRHIGMSGGVAECLRALEVGGYETVQVPYNLLAMEAEQRLLPMAAERNAGVIVMRPLAGGKLSSKFRNLPAGDLRTRAEGLFEVANSLPENDGLDPLAASALQYILANEAVSTVIAGTRRRLAMEQNMAACEGKLGPQSLERLRTAALSGTAGNTW